MGMSSTISYKIPVQQQRAGARNKERELYGPNEELPHAMSEDAHLGNLGARKSQFSLKFGMDSKTLKPCLFNSNFLTIPMHD